LTNKPGTVHRAVWGQLDMDRIQLNEWENTYNEGGGLLFVCSRELGHCIQDLNATVGIDGDGSVCIGYGGEGSMNGSTTNLDGDKGVQTTNGSLKGGKLEVLVGEYTKASGIDVCTKCYTSLDGLFLWFEPSFTLSLFEDVMKDSVVGIVL